MPGFFDQPVSGVQPNPEPPETTLIRDMLARKSFDLQGDPYGGNQMRPNSATAAPAFAGSGGGPSNEFFYGQPGANGGEPPIPREPRMNPIQSGMGPRKPRTIGRGLGSFFEAMSRMRPRRDSRAGLARLLQKLAPRQMAQEEESMDGAQPSAQLPGFDGMQGADGDYDDTPQGGSPHNPQPSAPLPNAPPTRQWGVASNAGRMPAGYQPRNTMSGGDLQSAMQQYGVGSNVMGQQHGAARARMLEDSGVPAHLITQMSAAMSQMNNQARKAQGPDPNAMGVAGGQHGGMPNAQSAGFNTSAPGFASIQQGWQQQQQAMQSRDPNQMHKAWMDAWNRRFRPQAGGIGISAPESPRQNGEPDRTGQEVVR